MSWSGATTVPNWAGNDNSTSSGGGSSGGSVGNLYIVPDPPTIEENPNIGLEGRNEVPLPTKYKDFEVGNLTASTINGNPTFDASNWSLFRAISDVRGTLGLFSVPQFSILDFLNITCTNAIQSTGGSITAALSVVAGIDCAAPLGSFPTIVSSDIEVSATAQTGDVNIYGVNKVAGDNALFVSGGTTLTGGGVIHGTTIGALQVAGLDTNRIDVLPIGIDISTLTTPIAIQSGVICSVSGGAFLSLAGGDYIQYSSDQHYFVNGAVGVSDDFTDIYVGNIHGAFGGTAPLRINDAGRGVELSTINSMTMTTQLAGINAWNNATFYGVGTKVRVAGSPTATYYNALVFNRDTAPNIPIPDWVSGQPYEVNDIVFSAGLVYRCISFISSSTPPASDPTKWESLGFTTNAISQIWAVFTPSVANITGDDVSNITIGKITAPVDYVRLAGTGLVGNTGLQSIENIQTINLTSTIFSPWSVVSSYPDGAEVEYDNANWVGQFAGNLGNIPNATLQDWVSGYGYDVGNVRYYATNNKAYLCNTAISIGTTTPPPSDAKWTEFQTGNNGEDVWFPFTAPVVSTIVGDRLSVLQIGNITCVGDVGSYLEISPDPEDQANALIQSAGVVGIAGNTGVQVASITGDVNVIALEGGIQLLADDPTNGAIAITGNTLVGLTASVGDIVLEAQADVNIETTTGDATITSTAGGITLTSELATTITSGTAITLSSQEATNITSTANAVILTGSTGVSLTSPDAITLTSSTSDVNIETTTGSTNITSGGEISLEATGGNIRIHSTTADLTLQGDTITLTAVNGITLDAGVSAENITLNNNVVCAVDCAKITGQSSGLTLENVVAVNTATASDNITINTYYPPLRIYKNATIGSAISRAPNTAEVQLYQQTMTLKANTQYLLNMSYAGLTENVSTATPNNNWYIIYRVHQGTTPLTTANLWGLAQLFNSTSQAGGVSVSFMTTTAGTYTGRFYIRNQNATVSLTIANISATITEVF